MRARQNNLVEVSLFKPILDDEESKNEYGEVNISWDYENADEILNCIVEFINDNASIMAYGQNISKMKRLIFYGNTQAEEFNRIMIDSELFEIVSIKPLKFYKIIDVQKI